MPRHQNGKPRGLPPTGSVTYLEHPRADVVSALARRLRRVVDHQTLERILRQTEEEVGID